MSQQVVYRREISRGESVEIRTTLRDIPIGASVNHMSAMLETADIAASMMVEHIREKMELAVSIFASKPVSDEQIARSSAGLTLPGLDLSAFMDEAPAQQKSVQQKPTLKDLPQIPEHVSDDRDRRAFGHAYEGHPLDPSDWETLITKDGGESGGGQCKALNTLLSDKGFTKNRHTACNFLLLHLTGRRERVVSLSDITKAEAHLLIDWLSLAPRSSIDLLAKAVDDYDPFDEEPVFVTHVNPQQETLPV